MNTLDEEVDTIDGGKIIKHGHDAPAWMVTYADLMSLLFALFVLLLSFSTVNDNSFQKNAGPMREAFNQNSDFKTDEQSHLSGGRGILSGVKSVPMDLPETDALRDVMVAQLRRSLAVDIANHLVELEETKLGVVLRFPSETAFESGGSELSGASYSSLDKIIPILARTPGEIKVGGHTDDIPISTLQYRSNWDLSSARATSVVHYFLRSGQIPKKRMTSQGYADSRPLIEAETPAARAKNRRVEISIEVPEDTKDAQKILEKMQPKRRVWTVQEGEKQLLPGAEQIDLEKRRSDARAKAKSEADLAEELNKKSNRVIKQDLQSIGRQ
ncbi:putative Flagellar motor protein MotB [Candidatus Terasakiella magnetica]|uniref:Putative Flagellar motor protein MotB n=1 Tax=Candidatus Terasakiella magnetica TaxID=1867952 RepID=A0A1C3RGP3_9PROT|nr:flagellar motor protein MotB [Candidatus Terasakiella magnetica]SCA56418.1 putative Flagellar motor protein MotB [Candidatus Terasakiella magnetica]